jgi:predicted TIM-barrel fold metal-dependent hydrolase
MPVLAEMDRTPETRTLPYKVYDADGHYYETADAFLRHLPAKYKRDFQYVMVNGRPKLAINGQITEYIPNPTFEIVAPPGSHELWFRGKNVEGKTMRELSGDPLLSQPEFYSGEARLKMLDVQGVHAQLIFPTLASVIEPRMGYDLNVLTAALHSLNQWVVDDWGFARENRLFAAPVISLADPDWAEKELEWALKNGARFIMIRPAPVPGYRGTRSLGDPAFDRFWSKVEEANIFVVLHVADSGYDEILNWWTGATGEALAFERSDAMKTMVDSPGRAISDTLSCFICHHVLDRHPNLRLLSAENGSTWLAHLMHQLKRAYGQMPKDFKGHPIDTLRKHLFIAPYYEENVPELVEAIGEDRVLFNSDWPHAEALARPLDFLDEIKELTPKQQEKIMSTNLKGLLEGKRD